MTNETNSVAKTSNKPTHYAYCVRENSEKKSAMWLIVGAAWPHKSGRGFNIELESVPLSGRIVLLNASEKRK